jgi:hypothetical protein
VRFPLSGSMDRSVSSKGVKSAGRHRILSK